VRGCVRACARCVVCAYLGRLTDLQEFETLLDEFVPLPRSIFVCACLKHIHIWTQPKPEGDP